MLPAAQKSDRRTFSTISGNSWGLPIHLLRGFGIFSNEFFSGISSSNFGLTRLVALYMVLISNCQGLLYIGIINHAAQEKALPLKIFGLD